MFDRERKGIFVSKKSAEPADFIVLQHVLVYDGGGEGGLLKALKDAKSSLESSEMTKETKSLMSLARQVICFVDGAWILTMWLS